MATKTNLYLDKILLEHPIAAWTLDEEFATTGPLTDISSFYPVTSAVIPIQTTSNGSGYMSFNTSTAHGLSTRDWVTISGVTPTGYNGKYKVYDVASTTNFTVNGITSGNVTIAGTVTKNYPAYELTAYNSSKYPGYVWRNNPLTSKIPMVYGSEKSQYGSMIIPSFGFLSSTGKYNQYTFETWVKIRRSFDTNKRKLIGLFDNTAATDDGNGLYYNDTSFILQIGNKNDAAFIKQTNKPMLIHIVYSENAASLYVNGEQLINLILDKADIDLLTTPGNNKEYISLQSATFDCPAIYPYKLSATQTKVHYAYGQAVSVPETINKKYGGKTVSIDFPSAGYAATQSYPINAQWKNAVSDNVEIRDYSISNKEFGLPTFNLYDPVTEQYKTENDFFTYMSANGSWYTKGGSLSTMNSNQEFPSLNLFNNGLKAFYASYYTSGAPSTSEKTIFKIINKFDKNYLRITMQYVGSNIEIKYKFKYNSSTETLLSTKIDAHYFVSGPSYNFFFVGMDIQKFANSYDSNIKNFFNNLEQLTMFTFGDSDLTIDSTPSATVYGIKFLTQFELDKRAPYFVDSTGRFFFPANAATSTTTEAIINAYPANYEVKYISSNNIYNTSYTYSSAAISKKYFSTASSGYWKNDTPLQHFAKFVKDSGGNNVYTFNNIQFNIDYDAPIANNSNASPKQFDTSLSNVKTYITFEPVLSTYKPDSYFTNGISKLSIDRVVRPDSNWATTKYEVVDGTIIYPPSGVDISTISLVKHIDIAISDTVNNTVNIKSLELASQALSLNTTTQNPVYTKYGAKIIPYTYNTSTGVYDYSGLGNARNPFIIEKKTSPHLSLDRLSGIRLVGFDVTPTNTIRGLKIPINEKLNSNSKLNAIQMFIYYDATIDPTQSNRESFQFSTKEIFNIVASDRTLTSTLTNTGSYLETATVSTSSTIGTLDQDVQYYINGELSTTPTIKTNEWVVFTIVFLKPIVFDNFTGSFNITGPIAIDNITFYGVSANEFLNSTADSTWYNILNQPGSGTYTWNTWAGKTWNDLLTMYDTTNYPINPVNMYGLYTGTNILYPGQYDQTKKTLVKDVQYRFYGGYKTSKYTYL
jgi:hypothetical protein